MNHTSNPEPSAQPGASAELTEAELDSVTGAAMAVGSRGTTTTIRPTSPPTTSPTGSPSTGQDVQPVRPFQPQTSPV